MDPIPGEGGGGGGGGLSYEIEKCDCRKFLKRALKETRNLLCGCGSHCFLLLRGNNCLRKVVPVIIYFLA